MSTTHRTHQKRKLLTNGRIKQVLIYKPTTNSHFHWPFRFANSFCTLNASSEFFVFFRIYFNVCQENIVELHPDIQINAIESKKNTCHIFEWTVEIRYDYSIHLVEDRITHSIRERRTFQKVSSYAAFFSGKNILYFSNNKLQICNILLF